jgi:CBS domain containing-hemolysin-like protein
VATLVGVPLAASVRAFDPLMPFFRWSLVISRRLIWPGFVPEDYLRVRDLERALELSTSDTALLKQEQSVLERLVSLSEFRADEMMRPRTRFKTYRPPVSLDDLRGQLPPSGFVLLAEADADEVVAAIPLSRMAYLPPEHLEHHAEEVIYVPWCSNVATVFEELRRQDLQVAAVVNEFGETIGIVTLDDILDTIFSDNSSRSSRLLHRTPISEVQPGVWHVTGMTSLRRLSRHFGVALPPSKSLTMAGVVGELLERFPLAGDEGLWGDFRFKVLFVTELGQLMLELTRASEAEESS